MSIRLEKYSSKLASAHKEFVISTFGNRRKRMNVDYLMWKFGCKVGTESDNFILAFDGEKVIGQIGYIPCKLKVNSRDIEAHWAGNLMVHPEYRGQGVAQMLYSYGTKRKLTLGSDPSPMAAKSMERFRFKAITSNHKHFFPSTVSVILSKKKFHVKNWIGHLQWPFILKHNKCTADYKPVDLKQYLTCYQNLISERNEVRVIHDIDFWNWRGNSFKDYRAPTVFFSENHSFCCAILYTRTQLIVEDIVVKCKKSYVKCLSFLVKLMLLHNKAEIKMTSHDKYSCSVLARNGFIKYRTPTRIIFYDPDNNPEIITALSTSNFRYTLCDSDENL